MLTLADETGPTFTSWETQLMNQVTEIADVVFTCENKIKNFHKIISSEENCISLMASGSKGELNKSFVSPNATQPKLKKINVPEFDGDFLKFDNFRRLFENLIRNNDEHFLEKRSWGKN